MFWRKPIPKIDTELLMRQAVARQREIESMPRIPTRIQNFPEIKDSLLGVTFDRLESMMEGAYKTAKVSNCKNCAAPLDWTKPKCLYCGTQFQATAQEKTPEQFLAEAKHGFSLAQLELKQRQRMSFWQGLIVAGATVSGVGRIR